MATIVTRAGKGSPLTHDEVDSNFSNLNTDKVETSAIGTAAAADTGDFATAAQGTLADTAVQPNDDPTLNIVTITNEIKFEGNAGSNAIIQKNASAGRDELQIYAGGDAYSTGSRGAGIHLYGNSDNQHDGNFAVLTGPDDNGDGRIIASGREDKTHVTIGNSIWNYVDDGDDHALLNLKGADGQPALLIEGASATEGDIVTVTGEAMSFGHWDKASTTFTERMQIDSSGNVGIGTSIPNSLLEVRSSGNTAETIAKFGNAAVNGAFSIETNGNLEWGFNTLNSRNMTFSTNQTERMRIDSSGNVGIGTNSPSHNLDVVGVGDTALHIIATSSGAGNDDDASLVLDAAETGEAILSFRQDGVEKARIEYFEGGGPDVNFTTNAGTGANFDFQPEGSLAMRIDSSGNVGIGKTNPATALDVNGTVTATRFHGAEGTVRAWVNWKNSGGNSLVDSGNVSSVTDIAVGVFRTNFSTAFAAATYGAAGMINANGGNQIAALSFNTSGGGNTYTTTSIGHAAEDVDGGYIDSINNTITYVI